MTHSSFIGIASVFRSFKVLMIGPTTALHCLFRSPVVDDFKLVSRDETQESDQLKCNQLHVVQALCTSKFQTACCWHLKPCICYLPIYALSANGINSGACNCPSQLLRFSRPQTGHAACVRWVLVPALQASGVAHYDPRSHNVDRVRKVILE